MIGSSGCMLSSHPTCKIAQYTQYYQSNDKSTLFKGVWDSHETCACDEV